MFALKGELYSRTHEPHLPSKGPNDEAIIQKRDLTASGQVEGIWSVAAPPKLVESDLVCCVVRNRLPKLPSSVSRIGWINRQRNNLVRILAHWRSSLFRLVRGTFSSV